MSRSPAADAAGFPNGHMNVYISAMFDYRLCNLEVVPKHGPVNAANNVYMLRHYLARRKIHQITGSA